MRSWPAYPHSPRPARRELGHHLDRADGPYSQSPEFLSLSASGYFPKLDSHSYELPGYVTNYAKTASSEDFADSVGYYLCDPSALEGVAPAKYAYLKSRVFGGREFHPEGEAPWPAVDAHRGDALKLGDTVSACLDEVREISKDAYGEAYGTDATRYRYRPTPEATSDMTDSPSAFLALNSCLDDRVTKVSDHLRRDADFCAHGGAAGVKARLEAPFDAVLYPVMRAAERIALSGSAGKSLAANRSALRARMETEIGAALAGLSKHDRGEVLDHATDLVRRSFGIGVER